MEPPTKVKLRVATTVKPLTLNDDCFFKSNRDMMGREREGSLKCMRQMPKIIESVRAKSKSDHIRVSLCEKRTRELKEGRGELSL